MLTAIYIEFDAIIRSWSFPFMINDVPLEQATVSVDQPPNKMAKKFVWNFWEFILIKKSDFNKLLSKITRRNE